MSVTAGDGGGADLAQGPSRLVIDAAEVVGHADRLEQSAARLAGAVRRSFTAAAHSDAAALYQPALGRLADARAALGAGIERWSADSSDTAREWAASVSAYRITDDLPLSVPQSPQQASSLSVSGLPSSLSVPRPPSSTA